MLGPAVYDTGTISVANGGTTVTGVGTAWKSMEIRVGDILHDPAQGIVARVTADATSETSLSINAWAGTALVGDAYEIWIQPDTARASERSRALMEEFRVIRANGQGLLYAFDDLTAAADPGAGFFRLNNADPTLATAIYIDNTNGNGTDVSGEIDSWGSSSSVVKGTVRLQMLRDRSIAYTYEVSSVTNSTGYRTVVIDYVSGSGAVLADDAVMISFAAKGDTVMGKPILIWAEGQSNIAIIESYTWPDAPPPNLYVWDWSAYVDGTGTGTGTAFYQLDGTNVNVAWAYAAKVAHANPSRPVYVGTSGIGTQPIAKWLSGGGSPDMHALTKRNIEAALAIINEEVELRWFWWQGENDAVAFSTTYVANFESRLARLRAETWYPRNTPIIMMAMSSYATAGYPGTNAFNNNFAQLASLHPAVITFVDTREELANTYWDSGVGYIHMTGVGYYLAGGMGYEAADRNIGRAVLGSSVFISPASKQLIQPSLVAFQAHNSNAFTYVATPLTITSWTEQGDVGGFFNASTGVYAFPETGWMVFSFSLKNQNSNTAIAAKLYYAGSPVTGSERIGYYAQTTIESGPILVYGTKGQTVAVVLTLGATLGASGTPNIFNGVWLG